MRRAIGWIALVSLIATSTGCELVGENGAGTGSTFDSTVAVMRPAGTAPITTHASAAAALTASTTGESRTTTTATVAAEKASSVQPPAFDEEIVEGLIWMREEEKLARDVYQALSELWNLRIFDNIAASEQMHTDAVADLLERYDIPDPMANDLAGVFQNQTMQALYDDFVERGSESVVDALVVGATIEDLDIVDLRQRRSGIAAIDQVYGNLERGSRNHIRAFVSALERRGAEYVPGYLTVEEYQAIVTSARERGRVGGRADQE